MTRRMDHFLAFRKPQAVVAVDASGSSAAASAALASSPSSFSSSSSSVVASLSASGPPFVVELRHEDPTAVDDGGDNDDDMHSRVYDLKLENDMQIPPMSKSAADVRASPGGGNDYVYEKHYSKSISSMASKRLPVPGAIEAKIKTLTSYLKSVSAGIRRRSTAFDRAQAYYRKSVPTPAAIRTKLNVIVTRHSSVEQKQTTLSWEDIDEDRSLSFGDSIGTMIPAPVSRKRGLPCEIYSGAEVRQICARCAVPDQHLDQVVQIIKSSFGTPGLDVIALEELMPGNVVVCVGMLIFVSIDGGEEFLDLSVLPSFLRHIQERYDDSMPFHNATHAADVMHTLFMLLWNTRLGEKISHHNKIGALLAAVMHDVEHVGLTNDFLIKTGHPIARKYPTKAPMESKHMDLALQAVVDPRFGILSKMTTVYQNEVLDVVRETISATALIYQPELLAEVNNTTADEWKMLEEEDTALPQDLQVRALRIAMHVSDISQTMKPFTNHQKWVFRLNDEHYMQGELDAREQRHVSPWFCFRDLWTYEKFLSSQVCFLREMALPAVVALNGIPWLDVNELVNGIENNIAEWDRQEAAFATH